MFKDRVEKKFKEKKYLLVVVILMIISALGLSISNHIGRRANVPVDDISLETSLSSDSYLLTSIPEIRKGDRIIGSSNADLVVFVYEDYNDYFSASLARDIDRLIRERGKQIAFVLRPFIGPTNDSVTNSLVLSCIENDSSWQLLRSRLMSNIYELRAIDLELIIDDLKLDREELLACAMDKEQNGFVDVIKSDALDYQVYGSPTLFIEDELILGARPYEDYVDSNGDLVEGLESVIERKLN